MAGEPQSEKRWLRQSLTKIQAGLQTQASITLSRETIRRLLHKHKIRPRSNVKRLHPKPHPDRDAQFQYIQSQKEAFQRAGWPVISVDTKKKELIGSFYQRGQQWRQDAVAVNTHDFPSYAEGRAVPYGIYDIQRNLGYVAVGQSADTPEFAVDAILWWWQEFGQEQYPDPPNYLSWRMAVAAMAIVLAAGNSSCKKKSLMPLASLSPYAIIRQAHPNGTRSSIGSFLRSVALGRVRP